MTVAAVALGGCADYVGDDIRSGAATIPPGAEEIFEGGTTTTTNPPDPVDPRTLDVGACFDDVADAEGVQPGDVSGFVVGAAVVPRTCEEEHRYELYARDDLATAEALFPGVDALAEEADTYCTARFEEFVEVEWSASTLDYAALVPDEARWTAGERAVSCALFDLGLVPLEGSMAGSGR